MIGFCGNCKIVEDQDIYPGVYPYYKKHRQHCANHRHYHTSNDGRVVYIAADERISKEILKAAAYCQAMQNPSDTNRPHFFFRLPGRQIPRKEPPAWRWTADLEEMRRAWVFDHQQKV